MTFRGIDRRAALTILAGFALPACRPTSLRILRIAALPRFINAPIHVADESGFFRDAGIALDIQPLTDTTQTIPLLAAGRVDVAFGGAIPALFNAVDQSARTRIVAARDVAVAGCTHEVHGHRRSFPAGFSDARLLKGKRVAVTAPTALTAFLLDTLLQSVGLDVRDVQPIYMRLSESAPALIAGQIDAVVDLDMGFSSSDAIPGPDIGSTIAGFQYSYVQFGAALLDDLPLGAAFLNAYFRGVRAFRSGTVPHALVELARLSGMNTDAVRNACRDRLTDTGAIDLASIQRVGDWGAMKGFLRAVPDARVLVDGRFLAAAR